MEHRTSDAFLSVMGRVLGEKRDGTQSIPRIHKAVRRQIRQTGVYLPWFSMLMRNIEKLAYKNETAPFFGEDEVERRPYRVLTEDLHCVELAVHHCKDMGQSMFSSVGGKAKIASHERGYDYPKNSADLQHLNELHYIAEKRLKLEKQLAPQSSSSSGQSSPRGYPGAGMARNGQYGPGPNLPATSGSIPKLAALADSLGVAVPEEAVVPDGPPGSLKLAVSDDMEIVAPEGGEEEAVDRSQVRSQFPQFTFHDEGDQVAKNFELDARPFYNWGLGGDILERARRRVSRISGAQASAVSRTHLGIPGAHRDSFLDHANAVASWDETAQPSDCNIPRSCH